MNSARPLRPAKRGFTLIEALVAVVIVAIGVVGTLHGFQVISRTEMHAATSEQLQKLALDKYDELVGTAPTQIAAVSGDLSDRNLPDYTYELTVDQTSIQDLMALTVTVTKTNDPSGSKGVVHGLYYQLPQTNTGGTQ
jgi:prepilin-type N-terminal cleavage/methylation domain-containing protein